MTTSLASLWIQRRPSITLATRPKTSTLPSVRFWTSTPPQSEDSPRTKIPKTSTLPRSDSGHKHPHHRRSLRDQGSPAYLQLSYKKVNSLGDLVPFTNKVYSSAASASATLPPWGNTSTGSCHRAGRRGTSAGSGTRSWCCHKSSLTALGTARRTPVSPPRSLSRR
nr:allene oxide cyclase [Ipomoea batatas]